MLLSIYYIKNIIVINNNKYNDNNSYYYNSNNNNNNNTNTIIANIISSIVNNSNIVYANTLTNNRVLYMDESGKLATSVVEEKKLVEINNKQNKLTDITITSVDDNMYISNVDLTNNSNQRFTLSTLWNYLKGKITLLVYSVGSIYINTGGNPSDVFGGSWEIVAVNRALWGVAESTTAGSNLDGVVPNITGNLNTGSYAPYSSSSSNSALYGTSGGGTRLTGADSGGRLSIVFNASRNNSKYTNDNIVRPEAYTVHIWRRAN